jgi:hypothetical protein
MMAVADAEFLVAKKTVSTRLPADLVNMANVVASLQERSAVDVLEEVLRPSLTKLYTAEVTRAAKATEKKEK